MNEFQSFTKNQYADAPAGSCSSGIGGTGADSSSALPASNHSDFFPAYLYVGSGGSITKYKTSDRCNSAGLYASLSSLVAASGLPTCNCIFIAATLET